MKQKLFALFQKLVNLLWGTGLSKSPFVYWVYSLLFRLLRPPKDIMIIGGNKMYSGTQGVPSACARTFQAYIAKGIWEDETTRLFNGVVKKGNVVVDLGANIGYYTLLAARMVGLNGRVYAFEPDPSNFKLLTYNVKLNNFSNVVTEEKVVSDKIGMLNLYRDAQDMGAHTIYKANEYQNIITVESVTMDEYFKGREYPIHVVKVDVEGAELAVLKGMDNIIRMNRDLKVFVEFHSRWIKRAGIEPEEFAWLLFNHYKFAITVIRDYTKHIQSIRVGSVGEIMDICLNGEIVNLLLEKKYD